MKCSPLSSLAALLILAAGCASNRTYTTPSGQVYPASHAADRELEDRLRAQLSQYGDLASEAPNIQISARDGTVTLNGPVRDQRERDMIDAMVRNTAGVAAVNDQLRLPYSPTGAVTGYPAAPVYSTAPPPTVPPAPVVTTAPSRNVPAAGYPRMRVLAWTSPDETTASGIAERLRENAVPADWVEGVTISVKDGNAYVQGSVANAEEQQAIISAVRTTPGVRTVYDQLTVR